MDLQTLKKLFPDASESTLKRNSGALAGLQGAKRERHSPPALDCCGESSQESPCCVVIGIISCRRRILDSDNYIAGCKSLRDAIARSLGCDDADPRLRWEYHQCKTDGPEGTIVAISIE